MIEIGQRNTEPCFLVDVAGIHSHNFVQIKLCDKIIKRRRSNEGRSKTDD